MQVREPEDDQVRPAYTGPQPKKPVQPRRTGKPEEAVPVVGRSPDFYDEAVARSASKQRSSPRDLTDGPTRPYQNGYGDGYYDNEYGFGEDDMIVTRGYGSSEARPPVNGEHWRVTTDEEVRYRNVNDERPDTSQSGRLSQAAMMVRERFEDGEFDQEVAVDRGSHNTFYSVNRHPALYFYFQRFDRNNSNNNNGKMQLNLSHFLCFIMYLQEIL